MVILVSGNPIDGFNYHGPFNSSEEATQFAEIFLNDLDWWIAPLIAAK